MGRIWSCCVRCIVVKDINLVNTSPVSRYVGGVSKRPLFDEYLVKAKENVERITKTVHCKPGYKDAYSLTCSIPPDTTVIAIGNDCCDESDGDTFYVTYGYPGGELVDWMFTSTSEINRVM